MSTGVSTYFANTLLDQLFKQATPYQPTNLYVGLTTMTPAATSTGIACSEVQGGNYARIITTADDWLAATGGLTCNIPELHWENVTWAATVTSVIICDAASQGHILWWGDLDQATSVFAGSTFVIGSAQLTISLL